MYVRIAPSISEIQLPSPRDAFFAREGDADEPRLFLYQDRRANQERSFRAAEPMKRRSFA